MASKVEQPHQMVNSLSLSRHQGERTAWTRFEAPLASLDCSITEPIDELKPRKILETPTLTSCLDYDELSDMIDDSLIEMANKGCLSRTTFAPLADSRARQLMLSPKVEKPLSQPGDRRLPYSELPVKTPPKEAGQASAVNQVPLLVKHHVYDYSSTSRAPSSAGSARIARKELSTTSADIERTGKVKIDETTSSRATQSVTDVSKSERAADLTSGQQSKKEQKKRFTFNLFNIFSGTTATNHQKPTRNGLKEAPVDQRSADHTKNRKASVRTRGTSTSSAKVVIGTSRVCSEVRSRPRDSIKLTNQRRRRKATNNNSSKPEAQADLTSDNSDNIRPSNSVSDFRSTGQLAGATGQASVCAKSALANHVGRSAGELLLDLSGQSQAGSSAEDRRTSERVQIGEPLGSRMITVRQTKSVKFTTLPDRVVMVSPANDIGGGGSHHPRHHHNHHHRSSRARLSCSAGAHLGSLPRSLNPIEHSARAAEPLPVPIIKRTKSAVRKLSSSYSQTDSSKNLNELLAKYEADSELVVAINERLKLTDTIASSKSALDEKEAGLTDASQSGSSAGLRSSLVESESSLKSKRHTGCDSNLDKCWHGTSSSTDEPTFGQSVKRSTSGVELTSTAEYQQHVNAHVMNDPIPKPAAFMNLPPPPSFSRVSNQNKHAQSQSALEATDPGLVVVDQWTNKQQRPFV